MDNVYDFKWIVQDIDDSLIFVLRDGKKLIGTYQVMDILSNGYEKLDVKFANIDDLTKFVTYGIVRFADSRNPLNIMDIPVRKLHYLYAHGNEIGEEYLGGIYLKGLDAFAVIDGSVIGEGYAVSAYKINEPSSELAQLMRITSSFVNLNMDDKINALEEVNLINYNREEKQTYKKK